MKKADPLTYLNFPVELHYLSKETDVEDLAKFFKYMNRYQMEMRFFSDCIFFVIDYSKRSYITMAGAVENISGFHPMDFLQGGLDFLVDIFHKDDFYVFNNKMTPSTIHFFQQQPDPKQSTSYTFQYNFRVRNKNGDTWTVLQKGSYIIDPISKLPLYCVGVCQDITSYKRDNTIIRVINKVIHNNENVCQIISKDYYYPDYKESLLSKREREILLRIADGCSSKQIADKLHITQNTVMNHRKNLMRKTNTKNVAELISYSIRKGVI